MTPKLSIIPNCKSRFVLWAKARKRKGMAATPAIVNKLESLIQAIPPKQKKKNTVWNVDLAGSRFSAQIKPTCWAQIINQGKRAPEITDAVLKDIEKIPMGNANKTARKIACQWRKPKALANFNQPMPPIKARVNKVN